VLAQVRMGKAYASGKGVPQDYKEAMKWYRLAADQGNASAQYALGDAYDEGRGVPQDSNEAVRWYRLAADQGYARAKSVLDTKAEELPPTSAESSSSEQGNANAQPNPTAKAEKLSPPAEQGSIVAKQRAIAKDRMRQDSEIYSREDLKKIESLYQVANKKGLSSEEAEKSLKELLSKYKKANRTGCALLYLGQMGDGDEQIKYLQLAIDEFGDCFYGDGVQVGAYARFILSGCYSQRGEKEKAAKLIEEIKSNYPDAIDHKGRSLVTMPKYQPIKASGKSTPAPLSTPDKKESRINDLLATSPAAVAPLPPPEEEDLRLDELVAKLHDLDGKVIRTSFNRCYNVEQIDDGMYFAYCRQYEEGSASAYQYVLLPEAGKEFFQAMAKRGYNASPKKVYFRIHSKSPIRVRRGGSSSRTFMLEAVGTRHNTSENRYSW
jgi:uncharacterized protein YdaT